MAQSARQVIACKQGDLSSELQHFHEQLSVAVRTLNSSIGGGGTEDEGWSQQILGTVCYCQPS